MTETNRIEYKAQLTKELDLEKEVVAFLNYREGGLVYVAGGSEKPYFKKKYGMTEKGCYLRMGIATEPMPQKMIEELFASRTRNSIGKIKATGRC